MQFCPEDGAALSEIPQVAEQSGHWAYGYRCPSCKRVYEIICGDAMGGSSDQLVTHPPDFRYDFEGRENPDDVRRMVDATDGRESE
jgi:hypothetical protein